MTQALGALMQLLLQRESAFRTAPGSVAGIKVPFTKYDVGRNPNKVKDPSIAASPLADKSANGDATNGGQITSILDLRTIGYWLALLLGVPTAKKAVTKQPSNVTGVTVNFADAACTSGNGTLTFVFSGTTLAWAAQGDTAGTAVNIAAGGRFTLQSGTANHSIDVIVAAGALAGSNKNDADIAVSSTLKTHVFPFDLNVRPSALVELGHVDTSKFYRTLGLKVNKLGYDITAPDQSITLDVLAGEESEQSSAWDVAPTSYSSVRSAGAGAVISNGYDASLGSVVGGNIGFDNGMTGYSMADGKEGYGLITQGEIMLGGKIKTVFDSAGAYALARSSTSTRLRSASAGTSGANTFGLVVDMPNIELIEKSVPKEGKSGLFVELDWAAHRDSAGNLPLVALTNDIAAY